MIGILFILTSLLQLICVAASIIGLPGNIISLIFPFLWWIGDKLTGFQFILIIVLIITGEILEQFISIMTGKKTGVNNKSLFFSFIGAIVLSILMSPILLGIGAIIGAFLGAYLGTYLYELYSTRDKQLATQRGFAALKGKFLGTIFKFSLGISSVVITTVSLFKNL